MMFETATTLAVTDSNMTLVRQDRFDPAWLAAATAALRLEQEDAAAAEATLRALGGCLDSNLD